MSKRSRTEPSATAPIYVTFNITPDKPNGGAASGLETEPGSMQTHNVRKRPRPSRLLAPVGGRYLR